jgi:alkanesulfonate monooxygenase SsuD/methylene tetrahydromethanopterin reductase-like flavin-dependent oxidoreductase (luciferase family)
MRRTRSTPPVHRRLTTDGRTALRWVFDHFTALYGDPRDPSLEAWTLLAGLASETSRVRLGTLARE